METMPVMQQSQPNFPQSSQPQMQQSYSVAPINSQMQMQQTAGQPGWQTGQQTGQPGNFVQSQPPPKRGISPLILAVSGIAGLLILISVGLLAAYKFGMFGGETKGNVKITNNNTPNNSNTNNQTTPPPVKSEMVKIPGGKFKMDAAAAMIFSPIPNTTRRSKTSGLTKPRLRTPNISISCRRKATIRFLRIGKTANR